MEYYQEIILLPEPEISLRFLWTKVFTQLHLAFVSHKTADGDFPYAVSFPDYEGLKLGDKVRVFAKTEEKLNELGLEKMLERLDDYVKLRSIRPVPSKKVKTYAVYRRQHQENSCTQKAKRYAKRHDISLDEAEKLINEKADYINLPYIQMDSLTNHNRFCLFISKKELEQPTDGNFTAYGLSTGATVPEF